MCVSCRFIYRVSRRLYTHPRSSALRLPAAQAVSRLPALPSFYLSFKQKVPDLFQDFFDWRGRVHAGRGALVERPAPLVQAVKTGGVARQRPVHALLAAPLDQRPGGCIEPDGQRAAALDQFDVLPLRECTAADRDDTRPVLLAQHVFQFSMLDLSEGRLALAVEDLVDGT